MAELIMKRALSVFRAYRDAIAAELGEIRATLLLLWLVAVVAALMGLMAFWLL
jgi:hypothetical protein